ncbi:O-acyltransferase WSD1 [Apostasia shenzhenica]|uniref:O-acyltransferase WSD1 n=1 Tax=Apostasia shenzhenica TaxID=1088818 RepID=A0A2I0ACU7_9ASPA|nr:O-acyltransferase WSD1 [Apostasia shenzhenica]
MSTAEEASRRTRRRPMVRIATPLAPVTPPEASEGQPLSPAAMIFRQPQLNCHIIAILGFGKIVGAEEVKAGLEATLVRHPRFSSVQVTDASGRQKLRWVRTKVNLDDHVVYPDLGPAAVAGDPSVGDHFVENYTSALFRSQLNPSKPLWDLHILAVRTSEAACVAIFRIHHSLGDGISLISLFLACTRKISDPESRPSLPEPRRRSAFVIPDAKSRMLLIWIWTFLVYAWNTFVDVFIFFISAAFLKDTKTPIMGTDGVEYQPKRIVHRTISLDDLKAIKEAMECTINDVLVGVTSAALSRYLSRSYGGCLPENLRIRTTLLVNIRSTAGITELADMMKDSGAKWGNQLGYILLRFPIMKCENPLNYIRKGKTIADRKKKSLEAIFTYNSAMLIVKFFGIEAATALCHRILSNTTLSFSCIVGPTEEIGFCGSPLVYIAPTVYGHPQILMLACFSVNMQALTMHFQSYMNKMKVVLAVDEVVIPNPNMLLDDISESLRLIKAAAIRASRS